MKILVLDNYDSFTYNLVYLVRQLGHKPEVIRNDKIDVEQVKQFDKILLSPGPGIPEEAGIMKDVIATYGSEKSILGVCLGHQGIAEVYGATLHNLKDVLHGVGSNMKVVEEDYLFQNVPKTFKGCHYHSWVVEPDSVNSELEILAYDDHKNIMALRHRTYDVRGVQFHPESIITEAGATLIENWIKQ